jgi:hypothetical protein
LTFNKLRQFLFLFVFVFFQIFLTKIFNLMKKVNFKVVLTALSFAFAFLLGVSTAEAQAGASLTAGGASVPADKASSAIYSLPQGNFQSPAVAMNTLMHEMTSIKSMLAQITNESDPTYIALVRLVTYYQAIHQALTSGQTVAQAIVTGLGAVSSNEFSSKIPASYLSLRNQAIALLD